MTPNVLFIALTRFRSTTDSIFEFVNGSFVVSFAAPSLFPIFEFGNGKDALHPKTIFAFWCGEIPAGTLRNGSESESPEMFGKEIS